MNCRALPFIVLLALIGLAIWGIIERAQNQSNCNNDEYGSSYCGTVNVTAFTGSEPEIDGTCQYSNNCGTWSHYSLSNGCNIATLGHYTVGSTLQYCRNGNLCYAYQTSLTAPGCTSSLLVMACLTLGFSVLAILFIAIYSEPVRPDDSEVQMARRPTPPDLPTPDSQRTPGGTPFPIAFAHEIHHCPHHTV